MKINEPKLSRKVLHRKVMTISDAHDLTKHLWNQKSK